MSFYFCLHLCQFLFQFVNLSLYLFNIHFIFFHKCVNEAGYVQIKIILSHFLMCSNVTIFFFCQSGCQ